MLGTFTTVSRHYIAIHQVSLLSHASYTCSYSAGGVRCPRRQRQQQRQCMTEGTTMAPWNGPNNLAKCQQVVTNNRSERQHYMYSSPILLWT